MLEAIVARIYRKLQRTYDSQRYKNIGALGEQSIIQPGCDIVPPANVFIGNHSVVGTRSVLWTTRARVIIKDYVLFGPQVTIITGDHITDLIGKHIIEFTDEEKHNDNKYDSDVVIEEGVWIGANVTILSGVHIERGCVIAAGAVVTHDTVPYGVYGGVPAKLIKLRFSKDEQRQHEAILRERLKMGGEL